MGLTTCFSKTFCCGVPGHRRSSKCCYLWSFYSSSFLSIQISSFHIKRYFILFILLASQEQESSLVMFQTGGYWFIKSLTEGITVRLRNNWLGLNRTQSLYSSQSRERVHQHGRRPWPRRLARPRGNQNI